MTQNNSSGRSGNPFWQETISVNGWISSLSLVSLSFNAWKFGLHMQIQGDGKVHPPSPCVLLQISIPSFSAASFGEIPACFAFVRTARMVTG